MGPFLNKGQPPYQLRKYYVGSPSPMSPPDKRKECHSEAFIYILDEIILYITNYHDYFDGENVLKQVSEHFLAIIRSEWPSIPQYLFES
jgi:hypothetical protein